MLTLYLKTPMRGIGPVVDARPGWRSVVEGKPGWRLDFFTVPPLSTGQAEPSPEVVDSMHEATLDRQERPVPHAELRRYDLRAGLNEALEVACRA